MKKLPIFFILLFASSIGCIGCIDSTAFNALTPQTVPPPQILTASEKPYQVTQKKILGEMIGSINVRQKPTTKSKIIAVTQKGDQVEILETTGIWHRIKLLKNGQTGYVTNSYLLAKVDGILAGKVKKNVNFRSKPTTVSKKITVLNADKNINVIGVEGRWYHVTAQVDGKDQTGWLRNDFVIIDAATGVNQNITAGQRSNKTGQNSNKLSKNFDKAIDGTIMPFERRIEYAGYSEEFQPVKEKLISGKIDEAYKIMEQKDQSCLSMKDPQKKSDKLGLIGLVEHGNMLLDCGHTSEASEFFSLAESRLDDTKNQSITSEKTGKGLAFLGETVLGAGEIGEYPAKGFEKVLLLNYKTISYLLEGDRRAYNVTRRAIDLQNSERDDFKEKQKKIDEELKALENDNKKSKEPVSGLDKIWGPEEKQFDKKAKTVSNAYVNPFADYISGLVHEIDAYRDRSILDNARISYQKALKLNPKSKVLKTAVAQMKSRKIPEGKKLVHVVVADGLAPERKVLVYGFPIFNSVQAIKIPVYRPVDCNSGVIKITDSKGRKLAMLENLSDIEAIALRHDYDERPAQMLKVGTTLVRGGIEKKFLSRFGVMGSGIGMLRDSLSNPDMRAWMTLPSRFKVARFYIPKTYKSIQFSVADKSNKKKTKLVVPVLNNGPTFVYARVLNGTIKAYSNNKIWITAK